MNEPFGIDLIGCARCHGDGHPGLLFHPLTFPIELAGEPPLTHWAMCPSFKEPILMRIETNAKEGTTLTPKQEAWMCTVWESHPGKQIIRALQRELDDLRRMHLQEPWPRSEAEAFIARTAHRDFSS